MWAPVAFPRPPSPGRPPPEGALGTARAASFPRTGGHPLPPSRQRLVPPGRTRSSVGSRENKNNRPRRRGYPNVASGARRRGAGWSERTGAAATRRGARAPWGRRAPAARGSPGTAASAPAASAASASRAARLGDEEQDAASAGLGPNGCGHPGAEEPSAAASGMDQCVTVERELEKVLHKFSGYGQLCERGLEELIDYTGGLKHEILQSHGRAARVGARGKAHRPSPGPGPAARTPHPPSHLWPGPRLPWGTEAPRPLRLFLLFSPDLPRTCRDFAANSEGARTTRKPGQELRAPVLINVGVGAACRTCKLSPPRVGAPRPPPPAGPEGLTWCSRRGPAGHARIAWDPRL